MRAHVRSLLLRDKEGHGYELMGRLSELEGGRSADHRRTVPLVRTMAGEGLVSSCWSTPDRGPARRVYAITEKAQLHLEQSMRALATLLQTVRGVLNRYLSGA
ncbi:MAG TPA: PadR family transcriptional regulator [Acidimicrobiales bacterium]|nr:PadR family transcriptional regulator [Acidimicrobiales bacterium]